MTALALWLNTVFAGFDEAVAVAVHQFYTLCPGFFTPFYNLVSLLGKGGIFLIILSLLLMLSPKTRRVGTAMLLALGTGALITNLCLKPLVLRPRPYTVNGSVYQEFWYLLGCHTESDFSFPSGHTTAATAAALELFLQTKKSRSWPALLFPVCMGLSRIYLSVHYCSDVLGGVLAGTAGALLACLIAAHLPEVFYNTPILKQKNREENQ